MESEWPLVSLGEVLNLKRGYDLAARDRKSGDIPIISSSGFSGLHSQSKVQSPGVITGRYGTIGLVHYVQTPFWPLNTTLYVQDFKGNDPRFVYYLLKTISYRDYLDKAAVPGINRNDVHRARVYLPPLEEQRAIAETLTSLDSRIALLQDCNAVVENIARSIFKSWFVDFDPVRAKAKGREPEGMDAATAKLFPSQFDYTLPVVIPEGWKISPLADVSHVIYGAAFASESFDREGVGVPLIRIRDLKTMTPGVFTKEVHPKGVLVSEGDVVVGMDGEFRSYHWLGEAAWLNQRVCTFKPKGLAGKVFVRESIRPLLEAVERAQVGTTVIHIGKSDIDRFRIVTPSDPVLGEFNRIVEGLLSRLVCNSQITRTLVSLRDTLLPRLISGKLRVPEAEKLVEAAL